MQVNETGRISKWVGLITEVWSEPRHVTALTTYTTGTMIRVETDEASLDEITALDLGRAGHSANVVGVVYNSDATYSIYLDEPLNSSTGRIVSRSTPVVILPRLVQRWAKVKIFTGSNVGGEAIVKVPEDKWQVLKNGVRVENTGSYELATLERDGTDFIMTGVEPVFEPDNSDVVLKWEHPKDSIPAGDFTGLTRMHSYVVFRSEPGYTYEASVKGMITGSVPEANVYTGMVSAARKNAGPTNYKVHNFSPTYFPGGTATKDTQDNVRAWKPWKTNVNLPEDSPARITTTWVGFEHKLEINPVPIDRGVPSGTPVDVTVALYHFGEMDLHGGGHHNIKDVEWTVRRAPETKQADGTHEQILGQRATHANLEVLPEFLGIVPEVSELRRTRPQAAPMLSVPRGMFRAV